MVREWFYASLSLAPWTGGLIALLLVLRRRAKGVSPHFFHLAFLVLALRLAVPVDVSLPRAPVQMEMPAVTVAAAPAPQTQADVPAPQASAPAAPELADVWQVLPGVWALGAVCVLGLRLGAWGVYAAHLHRRRVPAEPRVQALARTEAGHAVRVFRMDGLFSPLAAGLVRPAVYLPEDVPDEILPYALAHETCHLRRGDLWFKLLLTVACAMQWFNPLVWAMARAAGRNLELACDAQVLRGRSVAYRQAYGMAILNTLRPGGALALAAGFAAAPKFAKERIVSMFDKQKKKTLFPLLAALCAAVIAASALVSCTEAQSGEDPSDAAPPASASEPATSASEPAASASDSEPASASGSAPVLKETGAWMWPVEGTDTLSRAFSVSHRGIDIAAEEGTPIYAPAAGTVTAANNEVQPGNAEGSMGCYVRLDHGDGLTSLYSHCSSVAVQEGDTVTAGQVIAYVGSTGNSTGPHLHLEVEQDGALQDPMDQFQASSQDAS